MATYRIELPSGPYKVYLPRIPDKKIGFLFLQQDFSDLYTLLSREMYAVARVWAISRVDGLYLEVELKDSRDVKPRIKMTLSPP